MATTKQIDMRNRVYTHLKDHPEVHNQSLVAVRSDRYTCGTVMCIAGTTLWFAGMLEFRDPLLSSDHTYEVGDVSKDLAHEFWSNAELAEKWKEPFVYYAAQNLGLSRIKAENLFYDFNNESALAKLRRLCAERPTDGMG